MRVRILHVPPSMPNDTWKTLFKVVPRDVRLEDGDIGSKIEKVFDVVNIVNNLTVSTYRTESYALKQARRKYKKMVRQTEKCFMDLS